jgi:hypothetical protein
MARAKHPPPPAAVGSKIDASTAAAVSTTYTRDAVATPAVVGDAAAAAAEAAIRVAVEMVAQNIHSIMANTGQGAAIDDVLCEVRCAYLRLAAGSSNEREESTSAQIEVPPHHPPPPQ